MEDEIDAFNKEDIICSFEFLKSKINKLSSSHNSAVLKNILDDEVQIHSKILLQALVCQCFFSEFILI